MDPRLSSLIELQQALTDQREAEKLYEEIPRRRNEILSYQTKLKEEADAAEARLKEHEVEQKSRELELQENQAGRVKKEAQLFSIKNEKEYQATLAEIESLDRKNTRNEERIIELMEQVDKDRATVENNRKELAEKEAEFQAELNDLSEREKGLNDRVEHARSATDAVKANVSPDLFNRFIRIFDGKNGIAVAPANNGHCGVCNIRLTPRLMQLAKRGQDIVICEGCQRFLYWDLELDEESLDAL